MIELFDHNKAVYENFLDNRKTSKNNLIVQATGTGKSNIIAKFIDDFYKDKRVLYIAPHVEIYDSICSYPDWTFTNVEFSTYTSLHKYNPKDYDLIILDEAHRAAARTWRIQSDKFIKSQNCEVLGTTATELRMDGIDISKDMFNDDHTIFSFNVFNAIEEGILPKMEYVATMLEPEIIIGECYCKAKKNKRLNTLDNLKQLKIAEENIVPMKDILQKHSKTYNAKKFLVFCDKVETSKIWANKMNELLPGITTFLVNSKMSREKCKEAIREFEEYNEQAALISISKLNEGVHLNGIDAVIMIRTTKSHTIYLQQMGRVLKYDKNSIKNKRALVFDFVGNNLRIGLNGINNFTKNCYMSDIKKTINEKELVKPQNAIISYIYNEDINNIARRFKSMYVTWTDKMIKDLSNMQVNDFSQKYGISNGTTMKKRKELGIKKYISTTWTDKMIKDLSDMRLKDFSKKYNIPCSTIVWKRKELGIKDTVFITWTDKMIKDLSDMRLKDFSKKYGISNSTITRKRKELGIKDPIFITWTDEMLKDLPNMQVNDFSKKYKISCSNISRKRKELGIQYRNKKEETN